MRKLITVLFAAILISGVLYGASLTLTAIPTKAEVDAKIAECDTKPEVVAEEQKAVYDPYIRGCSPSMKAFLQSLQAKWDKDRAKEIAAYKVELTQLKKTLVSEPNDIKPIEIEVPIR